MATIADIRAAGYTVELATEGWSDDEVTVLDVYSVFEPPEVGEDGRPVAGLFMYLADDPEVLDHFLAAHNAREEGR